MISITVNFSLKDTHNAHTVTFTSWDKVSLEITRINHLSSIIDEEQHLPIQLDTKLMITYRSHHEREMNHIATGRALSPGGELLPPHHGRQQRQWRWRWSRWRWLQGQFLVPAGCRNREFYPPKLVFGGGGAAEFFWEKRLLI
jgi:hypothetical protein